jgi:hypothetical protein
MCLSCRYAIGPPSRRHVSCLTALAGQFADHTSVIQKHSWILGAHCVISAVYYWTKFKVYIRSAIDTVLLIIRISAPFYFSVNHNHLLDVDHVLLS